MADADILFERRGGIGLVTLNRPGALNALTHAMTTEMHAMLRAWEGDDGVSAVVVRGAGDRAFCAGGDIQALYRARGDDLDRSYRFYWDEYRLNTYIKHYAKPYVALIDGIVMGGGVGVSVHGSHRVVTEKALFAMPETGIGLFPDVGGTYFLPRCPGEIGMYLGLTGARLGAGDSLFAGVGTHHVPGARLESLTEALAANPAALDAMLDEHAGTAEYGFLPTLRREIDAAFGAESVEAIVLALDAGLSPWAGKTLAIMRGKSPTSLKVAFRQLRQGRSLSFDACMRLEYRLVCRFMRGDDFYEGIRAAVIDKDRQPLWRPATIEAVAAAEVERYFASLGADELNLEGLDSDNEGEK